MTKWFDGWSKELYFSRMDAVGLAVLQLRSWLISLRRMRTAHPGGIRSLFKPVVLMARYIVFVKKLLTARPPVLDGLEDVEMENSGPPAPVPLSPEATEVLATLQKIMSEVAAIGAANAVWMWAKGTIAHYAEEPPEKGANDVREMISEETAVGRLAHAYCIYLDSYQTDPKDVSG